MKIKWTGEEREISGMGIFKKGDELIVSIPLGKQLIKQNLAKEIREEKKQPNKKIKGGK